MQYIIILVLKIIEVSLGTIRTVLITKGERRIGACIGFFEIILWIFIASTVIKDISSDPLKAVFYALGFALGNYFGSKIEELIGIGLSEIIVIAKQEIGEELAHHLRANDFAVTVVDGHGRVNMSQVLFLFTPRKRVKEAVSLIKTYHPEAVITVSETKPLYGGYGLVKK